MIGALKQFPGAGLDGRRSIGVMVASKPCFQGISGESLQLEGPGRTVVAVEPHSLWQRKSQFQEDAGDASPPYAETRVAFSDIVEKGGPDDRRRPTQGPGRPSRLQSVSLIDRRLVEEDGRFGQGQQLAHLFGLGGRERPAPERGKEARGEVPPTPQPYVSRVLQSMQRIEAGRASSRTAGISLPQLAHVP